MDMVLMFAQEILHILDNLSLEERMEMENKSTKMAIFIKVPSFKVKEKVKEHSNGRMGEFIKAHLRMISSMVLVCLLQKTRKSKVVNGKTVKILDFL